MRTEKEIKDEATAKHNPNRNSQGMLTRTDIADIIAQSKDQEGNVNTKKVRKFLDGLSFLDEEDKLKIMDDLNSYL